MKLPMLKNWESSYYKKLFITEKTEKEAKIKELQVLKESETPIQEIKEIRAKYEGLKFAYQREYNLRKEKEQKIETVTQEIQMKNQQLEDLLSQLGEICEANAQ